MTNKEQINKIKDNAELAWAAYGKFHLANKNYNPDSGTDKKRLKYFREEIKKYDTIPTPADILNIDYKYYRDEKGNPIKSFLGFEFLVDKFLGGDFTPNQAKQFFEKYDLLIHQPNTESGFSACLFQNKETKEFTLALRGTDGTSDIPSDFKLMLSYAPTQYEDMILFYHQCLGVVPFYEDTENKPNTNTKSPEYKLWEKLYERNKDSQYKVYINDKLLKDPAEEATLDKI